MEKWAGALEIPWPISGPSPSLTPTIMVGPVSSSHRSRSSFCSLRIQELEMYHINVLTRSNKFSYVCYNVFCSY